LTTILSRSSAVNNDERPSTNSAAAKKLYNATVFATLCAVTDILNTDSLNELKAILGDELLSITQLFADRLDGELDLVYSAATAGDMQKLNRAAHGLKGSCANMGAVELARLASLIEKAALVPDPSAISAHVADLPQTAKSTLSAMRESGFIN
jgi:HPt (histidine-containing phosphotransfer) domain-containing protein